MAYIKRLALTIVTETGGAATATVGDQNGGLLWQIRYVKAGSLPYDNAVTFTITEKDTGRAILTTGAIAASTNFLVRDATVTAGNVGLVWYTPIPIVGPLQIVLAHGDDAKTGTFYFYLV